MYIVANTSDLNGHSQPILMILFGRERASPGRQDAQRRPKTGGT